MALHEWLGDQLGHFWKATQTYIQNLMTVPSNGGDILVKNTNVNLMLALNELSGVHQRASNICGLEAE